MQVRKKLSVPLLLLVDVVQNKFLCMEEKGIHMIGELLDLARALEVFAFYECN